jgi:hypothetical protein
VLLAAPALRVRLGVVDGGVVIVGVLVTSI